MTVPGSKNARDRPPRIIRRSRLLYLCVGVAVNVGVGVWVAVGVLDGVNVMVAVAVGVKVAEGVSEGSTATVGMAAICRAWIRLANVKAASNPPASPMITSMTSPVICPTRRIV